MIKYERLMKLNKEEKNQLLKFLPMDSMKKLHLKLKPLLLI